MSFIGIVSDKDVFEYIKNYFSIKNKSLKKQLINVNEKNMNNIKNHIFETIILEKSNDKININLLLKDAKYIIVNSDIQINDKQLENEPIQIITYGMNQKATITASSIKEDEVLICLQRNLETFNRKIEIQEFKRKIKILNNKEIYSLLIAFTIELLYS